MIALFCYSIEWRYPEMRKMLIGLAMTTVTLASTAVQAQVPTNCRWQTGYIPPTMEAGGLKGPFIVVSLQAAVDPAKPNQPNFALTTVSNTWFPTANFNGSFFLPEGQMLLARKDWTPGGLLYSGCRM
jgi:hypothetical protein